MDAMNAQVQWPTSMGGRGKSMSKAIRLLLVDWLIGLVPEKSPVEG